MNAIGANRFSKTWEYMAGTFPRPEAILCVSAHWYGRGQFVSAAQKPATIHDFYGFPEELYKIEYPAPGAPELAAKVASFEGLNAAAEPARGLDHGAWCVLRSMYPDADIPVCQLSVNAENSPLASYNAGRALNSLRGEGVLVIGSGNIVHDLSVLDWDIETGGYGWADEFDLYIRGAITDGRYRDVIGYESAGYSAKKAFKYRDHYDPLLYILGACESGEKARVFNDERVFGSISMTSYIIGE